jgi:RimJ/RimL family protein N-acetyltransferase
MRHRDSPPTLEGEHVRLEPLTRFHHAALSEVAFDPDLWRYTPSGVRDPVELRSWIDTALRWQDDGHAIPFATIDRASKRVVGSTRFAAIEPVHRRVEVGWTWLARPWQRTALNTEAKYLMLRHAFEVMKCVRVEFKTDSLNEKSRAALLRIGAVEEGTLRNHMIMPDGRRRHSVYFSVVEEEWPGVKTALEERLRG